jgi:hypothetical protein
MFECLSRVHLACLADRWGWTQIRRQPKNLGLFLHNVFPLRTSLTVCRVYVSPGSSGDSEDISSLDRSLETATSIIIKIITKKAPYVLFRTFDLLREQYSERNPCSWPHLKGVRKVVNGHWQPLVNLIVFFFFNYLLALIGGPTF